mmetsp:Transcript_101830/g.141487  ORF Transcript_101830/g.141487 Transcript_101830/m.141487 type:complete len:215 (-) Transcript_101830:23-667(-)
MRLPILRVRLAVNELHIVRALCITVSGTIPGTCSVVANALAAISGHLDEVHRPIHAAFHGRGVHIHGKLAVLQLEKLVVVIIFQEEKPRSHIGSGHKVETNTARHWSDTVNSLVLPVIHCLQCAFLRTSFRISTDACVPLVAVIAIPVPLSRVDPAPVGVQNQLVLLGSALPFGAFLHCHSWASFGLEGARLLRSARWEQKQKGEESHGSSPRG